jgi:hypothetical protein
MMLKITPNNSPKYITDHDMRTLNPTEDQNKIPYNIP